MNGSSFLAWDAGARRAWRITPSLRWLAKHDNGHAVSIGFVVGQDITMRQVEALARIGRAIEVDYAAAMQPRAW